MSFPVLADGTAPREVASGEWLVTLTRADVALGPAYFCATAAADVDLCSTAVLEFRGSAHFNALSEEMEMLGTMHGVTGTVRSGMFDYGRSWLLPAPSAAATAGAVEGHSVVLEGIARRGTDEVAFHAEVDVDPLVAGTSAVRAYRTTHTVVGSNDAMIVHVDPHRWAAVMDFDELFALREGVNVVNVPTRSVSMNALGVALVNQALPEIRWVSGN